MTEGRVAREQILRAAASLQMTGLTATALTRLVSALCDEQMGADELTARIESQPALCARVLQVANSPYYGQVRAVATIKRALLVLGLNAIRSITAAACIDQLMPPKLAALPDVSEVLRHSVATAVAAEMLARTQHPMLADDAFIAGILHNFGVVLQASIDPAGVAAMIATRRGDPLSGIRSLELAHCTVGHEVCAATVFDEWRLPESLVAAALHHHEPGAAPQTHRLLVTLIAAAADLALLSGHTYSLEPSPPPDGLEVVQQLGLDDQALGNIQQVLPARTQQLTRVFR